MRTPLHGVIASLDMIDTDKESFETAKYIQIARQASATALEQIDDVLNITKQNTAPTPDLPIFYNAQALIQSITDQVSALSESRGNTIEVSWSGPSQNFGLQRALFKAIYNLLSNAIKFTEAGLISISAQNIDINGVLTTRIDIRDTGAGISIKNQRLILNDFYSNTEHTDSTLPSTGLGLGIVKRSVTSMGGALKFSSQEGIGSHFWFEFPAHMHNPHGHAPLSEDAANAFLAPQNAPQDQHPNLPSIDHFSKGKFALIIEDHSINRQLIKVMAERLGYTVETAEDGIEGLQKAFERPFDLILTDVNMPNLDGLNTAACIRTASQSKHACIVAITARGDTNLDEQVKVFDHGIDGVVSKPFTQHQLQFELHSILEEHADMSEGPSRIPPHEAGVLLHDLADYGLPADNMVAIVERAISDIERVQTQIEQLIKDPNSARHKELSQSAHHAAGAVYFLGLSEIGDILIQIETMSELKNIDILRGLKVILKLSTYHLEQAYEQLLATADLHRT
jgi:CheY-like chemotaxis protein